MEIQLFGKLPGCYDNDAKWRRAWRIFGYRNSMGDRYYLCLTRCVKSDSACGWSYDQKRVRLPFMTFRQAMKLRRIGGFTLYRWQLAIMRHVAK
ncbi:hypothetical protein SEA_BILLNYE_238 [Streptomyces phage BillNye]|uniref:Uncharacterized protein n=2 Tax=Wilnyevirus billnye TaxID=2560486 RepID=A0A2L1IW52_9CAUD|nr:hypothetical protein FDJ30_gp024 [Streptomyces phage BillNye]AVD99407.1 hypothetical protein SEA_BILLNYE_238 [Streptomyces phage BillNye]QBZ72490.1 hypothetical protein SEA_CIRCINUS_237 [Streptomyces phage Circinus]